MADGVTAPRAISSPRGTNAVLGGGLLLILAPWTGEYLLGNVPLDLFWALPFLVPLYGGGALLIREVARRRGLGWLSILGLGAAYGVIEAGLVDQSLFNGEFGELDFSATWIPALGLSAYDAIGFVVGHAVWSIGLPIAAAERLAAPAGPQRPWLGPVGLACAAVLYGFGCWLIHQDVAATEGFAATAGQRAGASAVAAVLIVVSLVRRRGRGTTAPAAPRRWPPLLVGLGAFVLASGFVAMPETWAGVAGKLVLLVAALGLATTAAPRLDGSWQAFALIAGGYLTYAWLGFALTSLIRPDSDLALIGNVLFAAMTIALLGVVALRTRAAEALPPVVRPQV